MRWEQYDDGMKTLAIKVVDPMSVFAFCWGISGAPEDDPRQTYVEFALEPTASGTRLTVTESGFAQLPEEWLEPSYQGNFQIGSASFALFLPVLAGYIADTGRSQAGAHPAADLHRGHGTGDVLRHRRAGLLATGPAHDGTGQHAGQQRGAPWRRTRADEAFAVGLIATGVTEPMAAVMVAGMTPPLATVLFRKRWLPEEREAGKSAWVLGFAFITEGAIPFAARNPLRIIPPCMVAQRLRPGSPRGWAPRWSCRTAASSTSSCPAPPPGPAG
jgi:hypothetical protein